MPRTTNLVYGVYMPNERLTASLLLKLTPAEKRAWQAVAGLTSVDEGRPISLSRLIRETVNERAALVVGHAIQSGRVRGLGRRVLLDYLGKLPAGDLEAVSD